MPQMQKDVTQRKDGLTLLGTYEKVFNDNRAQFAADIENDKKELQIVQNQLEVAFSEYKAYLNKAFADVNTVMPDFNFDVPQFGPKGTLESVENLDAARTRIFSEPKYKDVRATLESKNKAVWETMSAREQVIYRLFNRGARIQQDINSKTKLTNNISDSAREKLGVLVTSLVQVNVVRADIACINKFFEQSPGDISSTARIENYQLNKGKINVGFVSKWKLFNTHMEDLVENSLVKDELAPIWDSFKKSSQWYARTLQWDVAEGVYAEIQEKIGELDIILSSISDTIKEEISNVTVSEADGNQEVEQLLAAAKEALVSEVRSGNVDSENMTQASNNNKDAFEKSAIEVQMFMANFEIMYRALISGGVVTNKKGETKEYKGVVGTFADAIGSKNITLMANMFKGGQAIKGKDTNSDEDNEAAVREMVRKNYGPDIPFEDEVSLMTPTEKGFKFCKKRNAVFVVEKGMGYYEEVAEDSNPSGYWITKTEYQQSKYKEANKDKTSTTN